MNRFPTRICRLYVSNIFPNPIKSGRIEYFSQYLTHQAQSLLISSKYSFSLAFQGQKYSQQAYTPTQISQMLRQELPEVKDRKEIIHQLALYECKILPFDYDYYQESLKHLIRFQNSLTKQEIFLILKLALEYKISNPTLQSHFLNELHCRLYVSHKKNLISYDKDIQSRYNALYQQLQASSNDHFALLTEQAKKTLQSSEVQEFPLNKIQLKQMKPIQNTRERKKSQFSQVDLQLMGKVLVASGSKDIEHVKLLLELFTIKLDQYQNNKIEASSDFAPTPQLLNVYTKLVVRLLQEYMEKYNDEQQTGLYTRRSIKKIYKLQGFYYYEVNKLASQYKLLQQLNKNQLLQFVQTISSFPIKKRSFRKSLGLLLIETFKNHSSLDFEELLPIFELNRHDNKLLKEFQNIIVQHQQVMSASNTERKELLDREVEVEKFAMPERLFKNVTKKKNKPKKYNFKGQKEQEQEYIDVTECEAHIQAPKGPVNSGSVNQDPVNQDSNNQGIPLKQKAYLTK